MAPVKKKQMLITGQIEHCLSHYPGIPLPLSKAGTNDPGLIIMDLARNSTLQMNVGARSYGICVGKRARPK